MKIKINKPEIKMPSQIEKVKLAVKLFDFLKLGQSYDECLEVVERFFADEEACIKHLQSKQ